MRVWILLVVLSGFSGRTWADDAAATAAPSTYAPADQLVAVVKEYVDSMHKSVADDKAYEAGSQRLKKEANTLACLALTLGLHDSPNEYKAQAPAVYASALALAKTENLEDAKAGLAALDEALAGKGGEAPALEWKRTGSMGQLMKQVTFVHTRLKRGARPGSRFESQADESAQLATVLAVIGQAIAADTHEVKDPALEPKWRELSYEMRDAAAETSQALVARNPDGAAAGLKRMEQSCNQCHQDFRVEIPQ